MISKLNLASDPFRNRALPWTVTGIVILFSIIALVFITKWTLNTNAQVVVATRDVAGLRKQIDDTNQRANAIKTAFTPEQQRSLKSAHNVVDRKEFSWSRLFADLENFLPGDVRVSRIAVKEVRAQGDRTVANLELVVASKNPAIVTKMIEDMEREGVFHAELVSVSLQRGKEVGSSDFEMNVNYMPRSGAPIDPATRNNRPVDTASEGAKAQ